MKETKNSSSEVEEGKAFAFLGVFLTLIGFLIVLLTKKDNKYAMYYAKQGLVLFIAFAVVGIINTVFMFIPVLGWLLGGILWILCVILWIIGWVNALSGEEKPIPIIGHFPDQFKI